MFMACLYLKNSEKEKEKPCKYAED
uniref:Uncharacterized protein n=1 Tax=Arundo donax TaxID=35708 RepID=A0A0A9GB17_ARUDO